MEESSETMEGDGWGAGRLTARMSREEQVMRRQGQDKSGNVIGIK
jgi:hypothetical protein